MQNLTDVATFTDPVPGIQDGDVANAVNTNPGFQALANRTRQQKNRLDSQATLNGQNYTTMDTRRNDAVALGAINNRAANLNFNRVANEVVAPGDVLEFAADSDFGGFSSAFVVTNNTLQLDGGRWLITFDLLLTNDETDNPNYVTIELLKAGVVLKEYVGIRYSATAGTLIHVRGSCVVFNATDDIAYQLRYKSTDTGDLVLYTASTMAVMQLADLRTYGTDVPVNPAGIP